MFRFILIVCISKVVFSRNYHVYVDPAGSDQNNGTDTQFAVKTIEKAMSMIPGLTKNDSDTVYIELMAGYHELERTLHFSAHQPPTVVLRSYQHQEVHVIGGTLIQPSAFKPVSDSKATATLSTAALQHVRVVHLPDVGVTNYGSLTPYGFAHGRYAGLEIFHNGKPLTLAKWPDEGYINIVSVPDGQHGQRFTYNSTVPKSWKNVDEPWVYGYWYQSWADTAWNVSHFDPATMSVTLAHKTRFGIRPGHYEDQSINYVHQGGYFRFENIFATLDSPGEYYLDRLTGNLYVWFPTSDGHVDPTDKIVASLVGNCIEINRHAANIKISDFTLEACRFDGIHGVQNSNLEITNLEIRNTGYRAMELFGDSRNLNIKYNYIHDTDGGPVIQGGDRNTLEASGIVFEDNEIADFTRMGVSSRHGLAIDGVGNIVRYNTIYNGRGSAIVFNNDNDCLMEWNHIHHVCTESTSCNGLAGGGNWVSRGNKIRYNFIHDILKLAPGGENRAVALNDHFSGMEISNNVFFNNLVDIIISGGRDNIVKNNVFYNTSKNMLRIEDGRTSAQHLKQLEDRMKNIPYNSSLWTTRYPGLVDFDSKNKTLPEGNEIYLNFAYVNGSRFVERGGQAHLLDLYNFTMNGFSAGPSDHMDVAKGDFRLMCHGSTWANALGFNQVPHPGQVGPRKNVGPIYLNRTAYNPLSKGDDRACTTQAPVKTTPLAPYLPDGSIKNNLFNIPKNEGCWLKVDKCADNEYMLGLERDSWGEEHLHSADNETMCLQRAVDQWKECGSQKDDQVIAIYGPTGASTVAGGGCFLARYGCPKHGGPADGHLNTSMGSLFRDTYAEQHMGALESEEKCLRRAHDNYAFCGSFPNYPFTAIYGPTGQKRTSGFGCWIHVPKCPRKTHTATLFYDAWGAANMDTDKNQDNCLQQSWYYWNQCGSDPNFPVTAVFRPTTKSQTYSGP